ncbi:MAG TPA: UDP-3-O-(3-hydroxymyristoyl)glucosamine N-acyltransferase [Acidobacteriaceae bacterium]
MQLKELAARVGAELRADDASIEIEGVASPALADRTHLVFAESGSALAEATGGRAGAVLAAPELVEAQVKPIRKPLLIIIEPRLAFARAAKLLQVSGRRHGIDPSASIAATATLGDKIWIGPHAVIESEAVVGSGTSIEAGAVIGAGSRIGSECHLYPRVVLYPGSELGNRVIVHAGAVLGADGFGYVRDNASGEYTQFPQQGRLVIEDDVEIGANTTIDRGALEETRIARGTKLDNLVHVGHNVSIGRNVVIAAQTGVSGSSTIGDSAIVGGQVGIADHVEIGAGAILGAQAGIPSRKRIHGPGIVFWGTPARPIKDYLKELAALSRLVRRQK